MKHLMIAAVALILGVVSVSAAEQTWTGKISDSMCGANHNPSAEHGGRKISDHDCTLACVKQHNAIYVFVKDGTIYNIVNQDMAALRLHAGQTVNLTGEMNGETITVSKIVTPGSKTGSY